MPAEGSEPGPPPPALAAAVAALAAQCEAAGLHNVLHLPCVHPEAMPVPLDHGLTAAQLGTDVLAALLLALARELRLRRLDVSAANLRSAAVYEAICESALVRVAAESGWMALAYAPEPLPQPAKDHLHPLLLRVADLPRHRAFCLVPHWQRRSAAIARGGGEGDHPAAAAAPTAAGIACLPPAPFDEGWAFLQAHYEALRRRIRRNAWEPPAGTPWELAPGDARELLDRLLRALAEYAKRQRRQEP